MKTYKFSARDLGSDLLENGALIPVVLTAPETLVAYLHDNDLPPFPAMSGFALIDTGADRSAVDAEAMTKLQIPSVGTDYFLSTHGIAELALYNLSASLPDLDTGLMSLERAPGGLVRNRLTSGQHIIMLLGRDLLHRFVLTYDGPNALVTLQG